MNTKIIALAAALAASAGTLTSAAEAGGNGVRLGFGFPMGTFVATPAHGGGGGYAARPSHAQKAKMRAAKIEAARRAAAASKLAKKEEANEEQATTVEPKNSGSTALIETTADPSAETPAETSNASDTVAVAPSEASAPETNVTETSQKKDLSCKKFVPSVGLTVSVACDN
jgi:hypothetical protein